MGRAPRSAGRDQVLQAGPDGMDVICIGGRKPGGGDTERFEDFWR